MLIPWTGLAPGLVALSSRIANVVLSADDESAWKIARSPGVMGSGDGKGVGVGVGVGVGIGVGVAVGVGIGVGVGPAAGVGTNAKPFAVVPIGALYNVK